MAVGSTVRFSAAPLALAPGVDVAAGAWLVAVGTGGWGRQGGVRRGDGQRGREGGGQRGAGRGDVPAGRDTPSPGPGSRP